MTEPAKIKPTSEFPLSAFAWSRETREYLYSHVSVWFDTSNPWDVVLARLTEINKRSDMPDEITATLDAYGPRRADEPVPSDDAKIYPCEKCGTMRSKNEGGTTFTVCDECWDKEHDDIEKESEE